MYKQQSQISQRQKLSLKNILNLQLENEHKTLTFQSRPKTMYTQRQMKMFQDERMKLMTDHKLKRSHSNRITTVKMQSVEQGQQKVESYRLKHALGRINILADGSLLLNEQQKIGAIYKFLECLSRQIYNYLEHKTSINKLLLIFINPSIISYIAILYKIQSLLYSTQQLKPKTKCSVKPKIYIVRLFNGTKNLSYKQLSNQLFNSMYKILQDIDIDKIKTNKQFQDLEYKLQEKTQMIMKLTKQIQFYEEHPSKDQYIYITELQQKINKLQLQLKKTYNNIKQLEDNKQYIEQYNSMLLERIDDLRTKLYQFQIEQFSNLKQIEKNSELKQFQDNVWVLKDLIHKGALRMTTMREQYNKLDAYNQQLLGQRSVIAKRAAVGFVQLTPRPNYKKIFEDNGIDINKIIPKNFKPTTEELVVSLIKRFKQFYETYVKSQLKLQIPAREKFMSKSNPGSPLMKQLKKMSKQLKKTQRLADNVKTGYTKDKEERQLLQKKNKK